MSAVAEGMETRPGERPRALYPDREGFAERDGLRLFWESYGEGPEAIALFPPVNLVHSRVWMSQIPYLARRHRVVVWDPPGNGRSDPCHEPERYAPASLAAAALAVFESAGVERALCIAHSHGTQSALVLAAGHPEAVAGLGLIAPLAPTTPSVFPWLLTHPRLKPLFDVRMPSYRGWGRMNANYWREHRHEYAEWFMRKLTLTAPHSELLVEDSLRYADEGDVESLVAGGRAKFLHGRREIGALARKIECPVLIVSGDEDRLTPQRDAAWLARASGGRLLRIAEADHCPHGLRAVPVNLALADLADECLGTASATPPPARPKRSAKGAKRILWMTSPIGLGHVRRDLAVAREMRALVPDLAIDWLTAEPVVSFLRQAGEEPHPACAQLASELRFLESGAREHELHAFRVFRQAGELLVANFMTFREVARERDYDLWVGDEAWDVDLYLHEEPGEKRAPFAWLTDYVGLLPVEGEEERERALIADSNALMLDHLDRRPEVRDLSLFVGDAEDVVAEPFGPSLPAIDAWTREHYEFCGYVLGGEGEEVDREAIRAGIGIEGGETLCVVAVGGSGVGAALLRRAIEAHEAARERLPGLRTLAVCGPFIDPGSLPSAKGLELRGYVPDLDRVLAAADVALVQGGLATTMELTAARVPFVYVPLEMHFEQQVHVHHRLRRHGAGRRIDYRDCTPEALATAIAAEVGGDPAPLAVPADGARRAAERLASLLG